MDNIKSSSEIEILVAQRVNKLIVAELRKILKKHELLRESLLTRASGD